MVKLCRRATCFFISIFVIISLWMFLQLGFLRIWLDDSVEQNTKLCHELQVENNRQLEHYKLQTTRLKKLLFPILPNDIFKQYFYENQPDVPVIYAITPTYLRPTQKADLTRLSQTLLLIPNFHWIVVEDAKEKSDKVARLLARSGLAYTHLNIVTPTKYKLNSADPRWLKPRGVLQRNLGISWLREKFTPNTANGVVYFADDDNTYDVQLFEEMRSTLTVSVWPVALVGGLMVERPIVEKNKIVGWTVIWKPNRPFPIDMAGFAVNLKYLLLHPTAAFNATVPRGYQESSLLQSLVTIDQIEPKADNCTKVLVWHTRTEKVNLKAEVALRQRRESFQRGLEV